MKTDPAYFIPLPAEDLQLLGELCAIQGQIEWAMQNTVRTLLDIDTALSLKIMGSTSMASNSEIWFLTVGLKARSEQLSRLARAVLKEMAFISQGRNDFVHAVFGSPSSLSGGISFRVNVDGAPFPQGWLAMRVRNKALVSSSKLAEIADRAAAVSVIVAHIADRVISPDDEPAWGKKLPLALAAVGLGDDFSQSG